MCGIMGYYSFGSILPNKKHITDMFALLETRGKDASGFAFIRDEKLSVIKAPVSASCMVLGNDWKELELPKIMIFHTRAKTQGSEKNNKNNHPLFNKEGLCIVHNGMIYNDKQIFAKQKRDAEVDSEAILAVLGRKSKKDRIEDLFKSIYGSFAVAVINKQSPDDLILIKKDNPLGLYYNSKDEILYFCSERDIMQEALELESTYKRGFNLGEPNYHYFDMSNNHGLVINKIGVDVYKKYVPRREEYYPRHDRDFPKYERDFYFGSFADGDFVECPYCGGVTEFYPDLGANYCSKCCQMITHEELFDF